MKKTIYCMGLSLCFVSSLLCQPIDLNAPPDGTIRFIRGSLNGAIGEVVRNIGDFNGDGWDDLAISSPENDIVSIIFGKRRLNPIIDLSSLRVDGITIRGNTGTDFGVTVEPIGDFNHDFLPDIAIGAPFDGEGGRVYILGGTFSPTNVRVTDENQFIAIVEGTNGENLGRVPMNGGDLDSDLFYELVIPNPYAFQEGGDFRQGAVYMIYGQDDFSGTIIQTDSLDPELTLTIYGPKPGGVITQDFAQCAHFIGDYTGNGFNDLALFSGIYQMDPPESRLVILPGGEKLVGVYGIEELPIALGDITFRTHTQAGMMAIDTIRGGDLNGDGKNDLVCGMPRGNTLGDDRTASAAVIVPGTLAISEPLVIDQIPHPRTTVIKHWQGDIRYRSSIELSGNRLAFGAPSTPSVYRATEVTGAVYIIDGLKLEAGQVEPRLSSAASTIIYGRGHENLVGISFTPVGDINRDGTPEIIVSAPGDSSSDGAIAYLVSIRSRPGDLNGDLHINPRDLFFLLPYWNGADSIGDLDGNGVTDAMDLLQLRLNISVF